MQDTNLRNKQEKLDRAMKAVLGMGPAPKEIESAEPTLREKDRRYRPKTRKSKIKLVEVEWASRDYHVGPDTLPGLQVFLKLSKEEKEDLFPWLEESEHTYLTNYTTSVFSKHIREVREREKSESTH